jgi:hypothetical protein
MRHPPRVYIDSLVARRWQVPRPMVRWFPKEEYDLELELMAAEAGGNR